MKKILFTLFTIIGLSAIAQQEAPPQGINYQAVVYSDNGNNPLVESILFRISTKPFFALSPALDKNCDSNVPVNESSIENILNTIKYPI